MRIKINFTAHGKGEIDLHYQHQIQTFIHSFLTRSNPNYAKWLSEEGYACNTDNGFKLFIYSGIIFDTQPTHHSKGFSTNSFTFEGTPDSPFRFSLQMASPVNGFLQHLIDGLFIDGKEIKLGTQKVQVSKVETLTMPLANLSKLYLKPLASPIFIKKTNSAGKRDIYLYPDDAQHTTLLNDNLILKYETLYGRAYEGERLEFKFFPTIGKNKMHFKVITREKHGLSDITNIKGTLKPFSITGPDELVKIGLECGFGQATTSGCGYVEVLEH